MNDIDVSVSAVSLPIDDAVVPFHLPEPPVDDAAADLPPSSDWLFTDTCLLIIAVAAGVALLRFAEGFFIPILIGIAVSYTLRPLVDAMERHVFLPRALGAALLLLMIAGGTGVAFWNVRADAVAFAAELPDAAKKIRSIAKSTQSDSPGVVNYLQRAANELDQAANEVVGNAPRSVGKLPSTTVTGPTFAERAQSLLAQQLGSLMSVGSTLGLAGLLAYLLLCAGNEYRRKLLRIVGGTLGKKKITIAILEEINNQMQRYLLGMAVLNLALGLATWALFYYAGVERAGLWGVIAALLHLVPYAGTGIFILITFLLGIIELGGLIDAVYLCSAWIAIQFAIGFGLSIVIQSRTAGVHGVALFTGVVFFGWLWGAWGLLIAVPLMAAINAIAAKVPELEALSTLLSQPLIRLRPSTEEPGG